jgi:transcriptional antiterminator NusG
VVKEHEEEQPIMEESESELLAEATSAEFERQVELDQASSETEEIMAPDLSPELATEDSLTEEEIEEVAAFETDQPSTTEEVVQEDRDQQEAEEVLPEMELEALVVDPVAEVEQSGEAKELQTKLPDELETETPDEADEKLASEPEDDRHWYVVHCYSGYENKVRHNLEQRIETMGMKSKIFDVVVPTEEEIEVKDGKRRTVERRVFPGYILVQMLMDEDSWYVVRNTPGVTGFVGMGNDPTPLRQEEVAQIVKRMEADAPRIKVTYKAGQKVRIIDGPFNDFIGTVADINMERAKVRVMVSFFGRETPVELDFLQVEKA